MRDEDDLRAALRSLESRAPDPAAVLRAARARGSARPSPHPARRKIIAAVAAAAAVTAVTTGVVTLTGHPGTQPAPGSGLSCRPPAPSAEGPPGPASSSPPGRSAGAAGHQEASLIPPYYIALTGTKRPYPTNPDNAVVYSSATGARLATVTPPEPYRTFVGVSAAANDRTFALAAQDARTQRSGVPVVFFLVHFSPRTRQARLTRAAGPAVPADGSLDAFALSPDGRKLAVAWDTNGAHPQTRLQVTDLTTGKRRDWASAGGAGTGPPPEETSKGTQLTRGPSAGPRTAGRWPSTGSRFPHPGRRPPAQGRDCGCWTPQRQAPTWRSAAGWCSRSAGGAGDTSRQPQ